MRPLPHLTAHAIPPEHEWSDAANAVFRAHGRAMQELFQQYVGEANWMQALNILEGAMEREPTNHVQSCQHVRQHLESLQR